MTQGHRRARLTVLIIFAVVAVTVASWGLLGLLRGPSHPHQLTAAPTSTPAATPTPALTATPGATSRPTSTDAAADPVAFARKLAAQLYSWDTAADSRDVILSRLEAESEDGVDAPGFAADLDNYLPDANQWDQLAGLKVREKLTITSAAVPGDWAAIAARDRIAAGVTAVNVTGESTRTGDWGGQRVRDAEPVAFTAFLDCPAGRSSCAVLRLSAPEKTLP